MRVFMVWESNTKVKKDDVQVDSGKIRISVGPYVSLIYFDGECPNGLEDVRRVFAKLHSKGFMCRSVKIFENGSIPKLERYGFSHNGLFYVNTDQDVPITAVPYGDKEWCMILERRKSGGVHMHMLNYIPYFQETFKQLSLDNFSSNTA